MPQRTSIPANRPDFVADYTTLKRNTGRTVKWANIGEQYRIDAVKITAAGVSAQGATALTVVAIPVALPVGTTLDFGGAKFARLTAAAAAGATSLTVTALVTATADGDVAYYSPGKMSKYIPAGTVVSEVNPGTDANIVPRGAATNALGILESDAYEPGFGEGISGQSVLIGGHLFDNLLPDATGSPKSIGATVKGYLATSNCTFSFEQWGDTTT